ncbi:MAG TPA: S24 family peptidase, partial [Gammaproteobacteria bacterium]|nr:S24 family peptidase [Gammaproteobacteria bacterium]
AGWPSPAEEELLDTMTLDEYLIENRDATYMLQVQGPSMKDAGIMDGDTVLVERTTNYKVGDIVVAEVDGEWTIKYLRKDRTGFYLEPANRDYSPLHPTSHLNVAAVVKAVIRKY